MSFTSETHNEDVYSTNCSPVHTYTDVLLKLEFFAFVQKKIVTQKCKKKKYVKGA